MFNTTTVNSPREYAKIIQIARFLLCYLSTNTRSMIFLHDDDFLVSLTIVKSYIKMLQMTHANRILQTHPSSIRGTSVKSVYAVRSMETTSSILKLTVTLRNHAVSVKCKIT